VRLRGRFTLWFVLVAVVPIAAAAVLTRELVARSYRGDHERRRDGAEHIAHYELDRMEAQVRAAVRTLASGDRSLVGGLIQELDKSHGMMTREIAAWLAESADEIHAAVGLDVLFIADASGQVLESPHFSDARGSRMPELLARARRTAGEPYFAREPIMANTVRKELVVEAAQVVGDGPRAITVVVGITVDSGRLAALHAPGVVDARVVDGRGVVLVAPAGAWTEAEPIRLPLAGADRQPIAYVEVAVADQDLAAVLHQVTLWSAAIAGAAVLITTLLALLLARRMTRDLGRLVSASQAAARGDLDHRVVVRSRDEIGALAASFNAMMEDLESSKAKLVTAERIAAWQEMARSLAHEIKNPLTPIQMAVETLRRAKQKNHPAFDETFEESTATVLEETARLKRIVGEFSQFARLPKPQTGPCDLNELVAAAVSLYTGSVAVGAELEDDLPAVMCDRDQMSQVLLNLLENARDALSQREGGIGGGLIKVITHKNGAAKVELVVEDNGPGIPAGVRERLFTPYVTTKQGKGGSGLGLAIVHRIISDHGGTIAAADAAAGGTRITITLPIAPG